MLYSEINYIPKYVQARNIAYEMKRVLFPLGSKLLFLMGCGPIAQEVQEKIQHSFDHTMEENIQDQSPFAMRRVLPVAKALDGIPKPMEIRFETVEGMQNSPGNIEKLWERVKDFAPDVVVGVGGGKTLDLARGIHGKCRCKIALMPTSCATNAPATRFSIIYNDDGSEIVGVGVNDFPTVVIVDPELIIKAPADAFASGIGDCIATYFEAVYTADALATRNITSSLAWSILDACGEILLEKGLAAYRAAQAHTITNDFEIVLEQLILGNGIASSAIGSVGMAHAIDDVLLHFEASRKFRHGQHVGYGVLPMMVHFGTPIDEIHAYIDFARQLGIPVTLDELGIGGLTDEQLMEGCEQAAASPTTNFAAIKFTPAQLLGCIRTAEVISQAYLK